MTLGGFSSSTSASARTAAGLLIGALHAALVAALWQIAPQPQREVPAAASAVLRVSLHAPVRASPPTHAPTLTLPLPLPLPPTPTLPHERQRPRAATPAAALTAPALRATPVLAVGTDAALVTAEPSPQTPAPPPTARVASTVDTRIAAAIAPAAPAPATAPTPRNTTPATAETRVAHADHRHCTASTYPAALRERGIEGALTLRVLVNAQGHPADVQVLAGSGWRLFDDAALQRVRGCRFMPALRDGLAVDSWVEFPVRFALAG